MDHVPDQELLLPGGPDLVFVGPAPVHSVPNGVDRDRKLPGSVGNHGLEVEHRLLIGPGVEARTRLQLPQDRGVDHGLAQDHR